MNFFWKNTHVSRAQVLADMSGVLGDILKNCTDNKNSLTLEERTSLMNEYSSLSDVRLNKDVTRNTLLQALDECKELKLRIERACSRPQEEDIMMRRPESPAATSIIADTDSTLAPSTKMVDPNPIIISVDPSAQVLDGIDSILEAILKSCGDYTNLLTQEERLSFVGEYSSFADARVLLNEDTNHSTLKKTLDECGRLKLRIKRACSRHEEDKISKGPVSPAATTGMGGCYPPSPSLETECHKSTDNDSSRWLVLAPKPTSPSERPISVQSNLSLTNGSHLGPSYPSTGTPSVTSIPCSDYEVNQTSSITSATLKKGITHSVVTGATFNLDSKGATGATLPRGSHSCSRKTLPRAGARQLQQYPVNRERTMYFAPGTEVNYATLNIRSPSASAAYEQGTEHSEPLTESFQN
ncbi:hypothetical protein EDD22DRAFT_1007015 [Suillus occidentalis]|nr:hypothetical protein EDD22DRAFT_1007015 [Suillus occidentalis]